MPSLLDDSNEPNRWCGVLQVGQIKYDWFRTRPVIFQGFSVDRKNISER